MLLLIFPGTTNTGKGKSSLGAAWNCVPNNVSKKTEFVFC